MLFHAENYLSFAALFPYSVKEELLQSDISINKVNDHLFDRKKNIYFYITLNLFTYIHNKYRLLPF